MTLSRDFRQVLYTKIIPPRVSLRTLHRPRITQALQESLGYRVTFLVAGAGYGKSTALSALIDGATPVIWYHVGEEDNDPLVFLLHLCHATQYALPEISNENPALPLPILESWDGSRGPLPINEVLDQYINTVTNAQTGPVLLVLDDVHTLISGDVAAPEIAALVERLISYAPPNYHVLLSARPPFKLPNMSRWRARGDVFTISQADLAFTPTEISQLYTQVFGYELSAEEVEILHQVTEGWAITLQLIWQSLRGGSVGSVLDLTRQELLFSRSVSSVQAAPLQSLFEILAEEIYARQPLDVQEFMKLSATFQVLTASSCDALIRATGNPFFRGIHSPSSEMLAYLKREELFVTAIGEDGASNAQAMRYQTVFHQFLRERASSEERSLWHSLAASDFESKSDLDGAFYHLIQAADHAGAARVLASYGALLMSTGRLDTLNLYLDAILPQTLSSHPVLLCYLGDLARMHSRFQEALGWYQQAQLLWRERGDNVGVARALRGQARVYLDTVNPSRAEELLQLTLRINDGVEDRESQARLYELLAENKLNLGKIQEADQLREQAERLRLESPSDSQLFMRVLLRTGRLEEARRQLEELAQAERLQPIQTPRAHRETLLLLSIIYAFQGKAGAAYQSAVEGTRRGIALNSPFITAVGHMRQGHALLLHAGEPVESDLPGQTPSRSVSSNTTHARETQESPFTHHVSENFQRARQQFERAIEISQSLGISRLRVEACWGLCRVYGYQGDIARALQNAQEAIEIATQAGDEWIIAITRLTMGASLALAGRYETASTWLDEAIRGFQECSDPFGQAVARLWYSLVLYAHNPSSPSRAAPPPEARLAGQLPEALALCIQGGYDFLFTRTTYLGPPDTRAFVPLLILARRANWESAYAEQILAQLGLPNISLHPGYQLRVQTLGSFQTWLGTNANPPIPTKGWQREKARQLFQLLITFRESSLDREQIFEHLWPEVDPETAQRNFKVALNTLYRVLEPERPPGTESAYIAREGSIYSLRPEADIWLDASIFTAACLQGDSLITIDPAEALASFERAITLYHGEYLPEARYETWAAAEREHLAVIYLRTLDYLSEHYLVTGQYDQAIHYSQRILVADNCWERAYRYLMEAYDRVGDHGQMARTYQRCITVLRDELGVAPAPESDQLYQALTAIPGR